MIETPATARRATTLPDAGIRDAAPWMALAQGACFLFAGLWPIIDIFTFQLVAGPQTNLWLTRSVGVGLIAIGSALAFAGFRRRITLTLAALALGSAVGVLLLDIKHMAGQGASDSKVLGALALSGFAGGWAYFLAKHRRTMIVGHLTPNTTSSTHRRYHFVSTTDVPRNAR